MAELKKFIFLDIDGVMAICYFDHEYMEDGCAFECFALRNLEALCDCFPDASIVISSTWRLGKTVEQLRSIFKNRGFKYPDRIIDKTPRLFYADAAGDRHSCPRGVEVEHWMKVNLAYDEPRAYVILDDDGDMMYWQRFNFVLIDNRQGLVVDKAKQAMEILAEDSTARYQRMKKENVK